MGASGHKLLVSAVAGVAVLLAAPTAGAAPSKRALAKLDGRLRDLVTGTSRTRIRPKVGGGPTVTAGPIDVSPGGRVLVDVYVHGAIRDAAAQLRDEGMRVEAVSGRSPQRVVEGWVPVSALDDVGALDATRAVLAVGGGFTNVGAKTSEGDASHHGPQVRSLGPSGAGITVGVMSNSINQQAGGVAASQASGDLPANVQVLDEQPGGSDEGRAMAEIVYDEAPGVAKFVFARGAGGIGPAQRAANIDALVANGARIIADDTVFLNEPMFQDGVVAQAADRAKANGVAYFVSAGNRARQSWEGTFVPGSGGANDFGGGDLRQGIVTMPANRTLFITVQWAEPWGAATDDFALDVYNETTPGSPVLIGTVNAQTLANGAFPFESVNINSGGAPLPVALAIRQVAGSGTPKLKWIANTNFGSFTPAEHDTSSPAIDPDAASARGTLAVAAVPYNDAGVNDPEAFSSRGPTVTRYFSPTGVALAQPDVRSKPDIAAADGVQTTVPGFNPFFGTSAAAPSAAGVAALLLSAKPSLPVDELYAIMRNGTGAVDCTATGFPDGDCGWGFILADGKLNQVLDSTPPAVAPVLSPAAPDGANGWYHSNVSVSWNVSDPDSPVGSQTGCAAQTVSSDGVATLPCSALSAGGTTDAPLTIQRDSVPPAPPTFSGIAATTYALAAVPPAGAVGCTSSDATSGIASCVVSGYSATPGTHTLTATAVDRSGLSTTSALTYAVLPRPLAASGLALPKTVRIATLRKSGLPVTIVAADDTTKATMTLKSGTTVVGALVKTVKRGRQVLRLKLNRAGKKKLTTRLRSARLALTVKASSPNTATVTLTKKFTARR
jgi:hypothetical protein